MSGELWRVKLGCKHAAERAIGLVGSVGHREIRIGSSGNFEDIIIARGGFVVVALTKEQHKMAEKDSGTPKTPSDKPEYQHDLVVVSHLVTDCEQRQQEHTGLTTTGSGSYVFGLGDNNVWSGNFVPRGETGIQHPREPFNSTYYLGAAEPLNTVKSAAFVLTLCRRFEEALLT